MVKAVAEMLGEARASVAFETVAATVEALAEGTALVVDVRQSDEFAACRIDGSIQAARGLIEFIADPASPRHAPCCFPARRVASARRSGSPASRRRTCSSRCSGLTTSPSCSRPTETACAM